MSLSEHWPVEQLLLCSAEGLRIPSALAWHGIVELVAFVEPFQEILL